MTRAAARVDDLVWRNPSIKQVIFFFFLSFNK